jgi:hypothetical protein
MEHFLEKRHAAAMCLVPPASGWLDGGHGRIEPFELSRICKDSNFPFTDELLTRRC